MAKEIERKFIVDPKIWNTTKVQKQIHDSEKLKQGYLSRAISHSVRVRISSNNYAKLTIKGKQQGYTRDEFEYTIPVNDAKQLMKRCECVFKKVRHWIQVGDHLWSVDEFKGLNQGLFLAEIEISREDEKFEMPKWVMREVTHDKRFTNTYLATHQLALDYDPYPRVR